MTPAKIRKLRKMLCVPEGLSIARHLIYQAHAHDYDLHDMPDDIFVEIMKDKDDYTREYRKVKGFEA